jgi:hypothetical protein
MSHQQYAASNRNTDVANKKNGKVKIPEDSKNK